MTPHPGFFFDTEDAFLDGEFFFDGDVGTTSKPKTKMASLNLSLSRKNLTELVTLAESTHATLVPTPPTLPPLPNMAGKAADMLAQSVVAKAADKAYEDGKIALAHLKEVRDAEADKLRAEISTVGKAVEAESKGDPVKLTSSGLPLAAVPTQTSSPPGKVLNLSVTASEIDGQLDVHHDPVDRAKSYELELTTVDPINGPWPVKCSQTTSTCSVVGLTSGQRVWIRVRALGSNGPGAWSDPFTKIVP